MKYFNGFRPIHKMRAEQISKLLTALLEIDFNAKQYDCPHLYHLINKMILYMKYIYFLFMCRSQIPPACSCWDYGQRGCYG